MGAGVACREVEEKRSMEVRTSIFLSIFYRCS